jgi:hypothetical protein
MKTINVYVKKKGFNVYYMVEYDIHKSNQGYKIAVPRHAEEITKYRYYKDMFVPHYSVYDKWETIHEIGNERFFEGIRH